MTPSWGVGILTWNDPMQCLETLEMLDRYLKGPRWSLATTYILDNGSETPLAQSPSLPAMFVHSPVNLGAGGGLSLLMRNMLDAGHQYLLFLEDDWLLEEHLFLDHLEPFLDNPVVGQVRLAQRARRPSDKYWTYGLTDPGEIAAARAMATESRGPFRGGGTYHRGRFFWSSNPFACARAVAERFLLGGLHELALGRPYYDADLATITTFPGYFRHVGEIRARRERPGWRK